MRINFDSTDVDKLSSTIKDYNPQTVHAEFINKDKKGLLFNFLYERVNKSLKSRLSDFRDGKNYNAGTFQLLSGIFCSRTFNRARGRINPKNTHSICTCLSLFLIDYMDNEFTKK